MTCRDTANLLPLFFDGELDARQMRAVALHSSRCTACERELRQLERVQELVAGTVSARVDELDLSQLWPAVEARLGPASVSWWRRLRVVWQEQAGTWMLRVPALGAAAAAVVLVSVVFTRSPQSGSQPAVQQVAVADNSATIDSLDTDLDAVAVFNDPETHMTVLWVSDETFGGEP